MVGEIQRPRPVPRLAEREVDPGTGAEQFETKPAPRADRGLRWSIVPTPTKSPWCLSKRSVQRRPLDQAPIDVDTVGKLSQPTRTSQASRVYVALVQSVVNIVAYSYGYTRLRLLDRQIARRLASGSKILAITLQSCRSRLPRQAALLICWCATFLASIRTQP